MHEFTNQVVAQNLKLSFDKVKAESPVGTTPLSDAHKTLIARRNWAFDFYITPTILEYARWLEASDEATNFTYCIKNLHHLTGFVSSVCQVGLDVADAYIQEALNDHWLTNYLVQREQTALSKANYAKHGTLLLGRRLGWYAIARICKPKLVIETGVDRGLGAVVLCRAIMRNYEEGHQGTYLGTDINPQAGYLLQDPLNAYGHIKYGDSIQTLQALAETVDLFIHDSDHDADYEFKEFVEVECLLSESSLVLSDNSHSSSSLFKFAQKTGRRFLHFGETPREHWYPGAGIGAAFLTATLQPRTDQGEKIEYLNSVGFYESIQYQTPLDKKLNPIPWFTYPFIHFLVARLKNKAVKVFEYGAGMSTLFWQKLALKVVSIEHDKEWVEKLKPKVEENVLLKYIPLEFNGSYCREVLSYSNFFDIIVIDGRDRVRCMRNCIEALNEIGVIILDNSEREYYKPGVDFILDKGFKKIDFQGMGPINSYGWMTSIFYREGNIFKL